MQNTLRKIGATLLGATMAGASVMAPVFAAADLQDYPAPFIDNGATNFLIVVGANAKSDDIAGAINVAVRLGAERGEVVNCGGGGTIVTGGEDKELALNEAVGSAFGTLKDNKLAGFQDTKLRWNSKDVDIEEQLTVTGLDIVTSDSDKDLGSDIYLGTGSSNYNQFRYSYLMDDSDFDYTLVDDTASKKLTIKFLGKNFEVTSVTNGSTDEITFKYGVDEVLGVGESKTIEGKEIKVVSIGQSSASISVDGVSKIISEGEDYDYGEMTVLVNSILYTDDVASRQVDISIGTDIEKTVQNGESMEVFGEPDEEDDAEWLWYIDADNSDTGLLTLGAQYNQKLLDHKDALKKKGEAFALPNDYAKASIASFSTDDYVEVEGDFDNYLDVDLLEAGTTTSAYTSLDGFVLTTNKGETGFRVNVSGSWVETDKVYFLENNASQLVVGAFDNADNKVQIFYTGNNVTSTISDQLQVYYQDTTLTTTFANSQSALAFTIKEGIEGDIVWDINIAGEKLGATQGQSDPTELTVGGNSKGTNEEDYRTWYGLIIRDPDSNGDSDKLAFAVPSEQLKVTIVVEGPDTTVSTTTGSTVKKAIPIIDNIARLDTDLGMESAKQTKNLILVGGPAVNSLTAQALGVPFPSFGEASTVPEDAAMIKLVENAFAQGKTALVVAGWEAENTRAACSVLQQFSAYADLKGTGVKVSGTTTPTLTALE